jgi:DnaJ-class molecular chaperone
MSQRDYYDILGLSRNADENAIKQAYRKLAREWHPDVNKADNAAERFSEIQEAYDVLSDPEKRKQYDRFGHVGVGAGGGPGGGGTHRWNWNSAEGGPFPGGGSGGNVDLGSIFEELFGGGGGRRRGRPGPAGSGSSAGFDPFQQHQTPGAGHGRAHPTKGQDLHHTIDVTFMTAVLGGKEQLRVKVGDRSERIDVTIPAGIEDGGKLRVRGKGHPGAGGSAKAGDMILTVRVGRHPWFRREGMSILIDVPISIPESVLGTSITVPTLHGRVELKLPPGAQSGQKLRIPKHGIRKSEHVQGDFFAVIKIVAPKDLSKEDESFFRSLSERWPAAREGDPWDSVEN